MTKVQTLAVRSSLAHSSFVYMGYPRLSECEGASAKEHIPGYTLKRGPPITAAGVGAVVCNSDGRARRHWEGGNQF